MKVKFNYTSGRRKGEHKFVDMTVVPNEGQLLISGDETFRLTRVTHTPESKEQEVILHLSVVAVLD